MTTATPPSVPPISKTFGPWAFIGIAIGITLAFVKALVWSDGAFNAEVFGYALGAALFPGLIAYAIAGRQRVRNPNRFALWFLAFSLFFLLLEFSNRPEATNTRIKRLIREAAGTKRAEKVGSREDQQWDALLRAVVGDVFERRKLYDLRIAQLDPDVRRLGSPESFAGRSSILHSMDVVRNVVLEDKKFSQEINTWSERAKALVDQSSLSDDDKQEFMKGFQGAFMGSKILSTRTEAISAEAEWSEAALDLYSFALENKPRVVIRGSNIIINDEKVRAQFNEKRERYETLRKKVADLNNQLEQLQQTALKQYNLTLRDVGLGDSK